MKTKILSLIFLAFLFSCQPKTNLERALYMAGKNRSEIKKVLKHYSKNRADSLKLKAAKFLIENMDTYYFYSSPELDLYYAELDSIYSLNERYEVITYEQQNLLNSLQKPDQKDFKIIKDINYVKADFLIDNIDRAFEDWQLPHTNDLSFDDFCEYLLPYKSAATELPDFWRSTFKETFLHYATTGIDTSSNLNSGIITKNQSFVLNGKNNFPIPENFDTIPEFSISCFAKPFEKTKEARLFDFGKDSTCFFHFTPYNYDGVAQFQLVTRPYIWDDIPGKYPLPLERRSHIAVTFSKNIITFYIDGVLQKRTRTYLTNKDLINNFIGKSQYFSERNICFKGEITDFRIYNRELNFSEICKISGKTDLPDWRQRVQLIIQGLGHEYAVNAIYETLPGGYRATQLINIKQGSCDEYVALGTAIFRSLGIPSGIDFIPQWATRSRGHSWNAIYTGKGKMDDYSFGDWMDSIGHHIKVHQEKAAKIFRKTYAKQPESLAMQTGKDEYLPPLFRDPCIRDVTDNYFKFSLPAQK